MIAPLRVTFCVCCDLLEAEARRKFSLKLKPRDFILNAHEMVWMKIDELPLELIQIQHKKIQPKRYCCDRYLSYRQLSGARRASVCLCCYFFGSENIRLKHFMLRASTHIWKLLNIPPISAQKPLKHGMKSSPHHLLKLIVSPFYCFPNYATQRKSRA